MSPIHTVNHVPDWVWRGIKKAAIDEDRPVGELLTEAIIEWLIIRDYPVDYPPMVQREMESKEEHEAEKTA